MKQLIIGLALMGILASNDLSAQELSEAQRERTVNDLEAIQDERSRAFADGDCERVIEQFDEGVTFYTRGRQVPSVEAILNFCRQVERPFPEAGVHARQINVLSETSAYIVQTIEMPGSDPDSESAMMREIITSIWFKGDDGWKIVHFHVSVDPIPG